MLTSCELRRTPANTPFQTLVRGSSIMIPEPLVPSEGSRGSRGICDDRSLSACPRLPTTHTPGLAGLERGGRERSPWLVAGHSLPSRAGQPWPRWGRGSDRNSLLTTLGSWVLAGCRPRRDTRRTRRQLQGLGARSLERGTCGDERPATHTRGPRRCGVLTGLCACSARSCARVVFSASSRGLQRTAPRVSDSALRAPECVFDV